MPWRRSMISLRPVPHSISNRLKGIKVEKCGPKLIILASLFYAYRRRRRTSSNLSGRVPSLSIKFSLEERTAYVTHLITDSSRTHGTQPDSRDSAPKRRTQCSSPYPPFNYPPFFPFSPFSCFTQSIQYSTDSRIIPAALCV